MARHSPAALAVIHPSALCSVQTDGAWSDLGIIGADVDEEVGKINAVGVSAQKSAECRQRVRLTWRHDEHVIKELEELGKRLEQRDGGGVREHVARLAQRA
eukprot:1052530-Rhodomonas_salina.1